MSFIPEAREIFKPFPEVPVHYPNPRLDIELHSIYDWYAQIHGDQFLGFPYFFCEEASLAVSRLGFTLISRGSFKVDLPSVMIEHFWCEDEEGRIIDLTLAQFNIWLLPHHRVPRGPLILEPGHPLHQRFYPPREDPIKEANMRMEIQNHTQKLLAKIT